MAGVSWGVSMGGKMRDICNNLTMKIFFFFKVRGSDKLATKGMMAEFRKNKRFMPGSM